MHLRVGEEAVLRLEPGDTVRIAWVHGSKYVYVNQTHVATMPDLEHEVPVDAIAAERERIAAWLELKADGPNRTLVRTKGNIFRAVAKAIRNGDHDLPYGRRVEEGEAK